jgi:hypothetical protein
MQGSRELGQALGALLFVVCGGLGVACLLGGILSATAFCFRKDRIDLFDAVVLGGLGLFFSAFFLLWYTGVFPA